jgi:hypothetical protein
MCPIKPNGSKAIEARSFEDWSIELPGYRPNALLPYQAIESLIH